MYKLQLLIMYNYARSFSILEEYSISKNASFTFNSIFTRLQEKLVGSQFCSYTFSIF